MDDLELDKMAFGIQQRLDQEMDGPEGYAKLTRVMNDYHWHVRSQGRRPFSYYNDERAKEEIGFRNMFSAPEVPGLESGYQGPGVQEYRQHTAMVSYFSRLTGRSEQDTEDMFPSLRDAWAKSELGKDTITEGELFTGIANQYDFRERMAKAAKHSALLPERAGEIMTQWEAEGAKLPGWNNAKKEEYRRQFESLRDGMDADLAHYRPLITDTLKQLEKRYGTANAQPGDGEGLGELAQRFMDVPKADLPYVFGAMADRAELIHGTDVKTFAKQLGESFARGTEKIGVNLKLANRLDTLRGVMVYLYDPAIEIPAESANPVTDLYNAAIDGYLRTNDVPAGPQRRPTVQEIKGAREKFERIAHVANLQADIRDLAENSVDPIKGDYLITRGLYGVAQSLPTTLLAAVAHVGLPLTMETMAVDNYHEYRREHPELGWQSAWAHGQVAAVPQGLMERFEAKLLLGKLPTLGTYLNRAITPRVGLGTRFLIRGAENTAGEYLTENAQDLMPALVLDLSRAMEQDSNGLKFENTLQQFSEQFTGAHQAELFTQVTIMSLMFGGLASWQDVRDSRELLSHEELVRAFVDTDAQARSIVELAGRGDMDGAARLFHQIGEPKLRTNFSLDEAQKQAFQSAAQTIQAKQEAIQLLEESGVIPRVGRRGNGYEVQFPDGTTLPASSAQRAESLRGKHFAEQQQKLHEETRAGLALLESVPVAPGMGTETTKTAERASGLRVDLPLSAPSLLGASSSPQQHGQVDALDAIRDGLGSNQAELQRLGAQVEEIDSAEAQRRGYAPKFRFGVTPDGRHVVLVEDRLKGMLLQAEAVPALVREEVIHLGWLSAMRVRHQRDGKGMSPEEWMRHEVDGMTGELLTSPAGSQALVDAANAYDQPVAPYASAQEALDAFSDREHLLIPELARQLIQLRESGQTTESVIAKTLEKIREWFTMALQRLRAVAAEVETVSPMLAEAIQETESILAGLAEAVPPSNSTGMPLGAALVGDATAENIDSTVEESAGNAAAYREAQAHAVLNSPDNATRAAAHTVLGTNMTEFTARVQETSTMLRQPGKSMPDKVRAVMAAHADRLIAQGHRDVVVQGLRQVEQAMAAQGGTLQFLPAQNNDSLSNQEVTNAFAEVATDYLIIRDGRRPATVNNAVQGSSLAPVMDAATRVVSTALRPAGRSQMNGGTTSAAELNTQEHANDLSHAEAKPSMGIRGNSNPPRHLKNPTFGYENPALSRAEKERHDENAGMAIQRPPSKKRLSDLLRHTLPKGPFAEILLKASLLVDFVHDSGALGPVSVSDRVEVKNGRSMQGNYWGAGLRGPTAEIAVWTDNQHPMMTMIHEIGHHVAKLLGKEAVERVMGVVEGTTHLDNIVSHADKEGHGYLMNPEEIFCRAYAQFVVTEAAARGIDLEGMDELQRMSKEYDEWFQTWHADEFAGVREALVRELQTQFKLHTK